MGKDVAAGKVAPENKFRNVHIATGTGNITVNTVTSMQPLYLTSGTNEFLLFVLVEESEKAVAYHQ